MAARLNSIEGTTVVAGRHVVRHCETLKDAMEECRCTAPTIPVPLPALILKDIVRFCDFFAVAVNPYEEFSSATDLGEASATAARLAWSAFEQLPLSSLNGRTISSLLQASDFGSPGLADWQPLQALVNGANYLALTPFLDGAARAVQARLWHMASGQIKARLGADPDVPPEILHSWLAGLDQRTLREIASVSPYLCAATTGMIVPYHSCKERVGIGKRLSTLCSSLVRKRQPRVRAVNIQM
jgi:hypothetical protein